MNSLWDKLDKREVPSGWQVELKRVNQEPIHFLVQGLLENRRQTIPERFTVWHVGGQPGTFRIHRRVGEVYSMEEAAQSIMSYVPPESF